MQDVQVQLTTIGESYDSEKGRKNQLISAIEVPVYAGIFSALPKVLSYFIIKHQKQVKVSLVFFLSIGMRGS